MEEGKHSLVLLWTFLLVNKLIIFVFQIKDGATALFLAAQGGYLNLIRLLLSSGAKVNQPRQVIFSIVKI